MQTPLQSSIPLLPPDPILNWPAEAPQRPRGSRVQLVISFGRQTNGRIKRFYSKPEEVARQQAGQSWRCSLLKWFHHLLPGLCPHLELGLHFLKANLRDFELSQVFGSDHWLPSRAHPCQKPPSSKTALQGTAVEISWPVQHTCVAVAWPHPTKLGAFSQGGNGPLRSHCHHQFLSDSRGTGLLGSGNVTGSMRMVATLSVCEVLSPLLPVAWSASPVKL